MEEELLKIAIGVAEDPNYWNRRYLNEFEYDSEEERTMFEKLSKTVNWDEEIEMDIKPSMKNKKKGNNQNKFIVINKKKFKRKTRNC